MQQHDAAPQYEPPAPAASKTNGLGIAAIALGGVGLLLAFIPIIGAFGGFLGFVGLVLGVIGLFLKNKSKLLAIIGTSLSGLALILSIVMGFVYAAAFVAAVDEATGVDAPAVVEEGDDVAEAPAEGASAGDELGARDNPAPFGSTVAIDTFEGPVWEVTAAAPTLDATADVKAANQFNADPAPGNVYAILPVTVTYLGDDSGRPFELQFTYVSPAGQSYEGAFVVMDGQLSDVAELYKDASGTGNVIIEIPAEGAAGGVWGVEYIFADDPIFFGNAR
ncbi:DUF4190 domain-containing protein [Agromyces laixinhei]|uniref:DUF4190 domain-containing protein n=1 Tax=Agromyces laixinhei TaxID=2585717 RepID=UPI0012EEA656|nr:DUF4190 domain-containing protein [Agromyces laixinhei]